MAIRTDYTDMQSWLMGASITGGTLIRYTLNGVNHTVSILTSDTAAILALLNSLNIGDWIISGGFYVCQFCTVGILSFRIDTGAGTNDENDVGTLNDYLRDYLCASMAIELETETAKVPTQPSELNYGVCPCACDFEEKVFAGETESNKFKSDATSFIFKKFLSSDSYSLTLHKNGATTGITINSAIADVYTYGSSAFTRANGTIDSNYAGFIIQWYRVFTVHGYGSYQLKGTRTINGTTYAYESHLFKLTAFNFGIAKGTVKIECYQNGYIESDDFNFTNFNWYQSVRVEGKLTKGVPKMIQDNYLTGGLLREQIQDEMLDTYELELMPLPAAISDFITYNVGLSNKSLISDYNVNTHVFNRLNIYMTDIPLFKALQTSIRGTYTMAPREQNLRKRNFQ